MVPLMKRRAGAVNSTESLHYRPGIRCAARRRRRHGRRRRRTQSDWSVPRAPSKNTTAGSRSRRSWTSPSAPMHSHADWPPRATAAVLPSTVPRAASFRVDPVLARTPDARANRSRWSAQSNHPSADAYRASSDALEDASDDDDSDDWSEAVGEKAGRDRCGGAGQGDWQNESGVVMEEYRGRQRDGWRRRRSV